MKNESNKSEAARVLGSSKSTAKAAASRRNGQLGGRPRLSGGMGVMDGQDAFIITEFMARMEGLIKNEELVEGTRAFMAEHGVPAKPLARLLKAFEAFYEAVKTAQLNEQKNAQTASEKAQAAANKQKADAAGS